MIMKCNEIQVTTYYHHHRRKMSWKSSTKGKAMTKTRLLLGLSGQRQILESVAGKHAKMDKVKDRPIRFLFYYYYYWEYSISNLPSVCLESDHGSDLPSLYTAAQTIAIISETLFVPCHYSSDQVYIYTHYRCLVRYISSWVCWSFDIKIVYWLTFLVLFPGKFPVQLDYVVRQKCLEQLQLFFYQTRLSDLGLKLLLEIKGHKLRVRSVLTTIKTNFVPLKSISSGSYLKKSMHAKGICWVPKVIFC